MGFRKLLHISQSKDMDSTSREASPVNYDAVAEQGATTETVTETEGSVPEPGPQSSRSKMGLFL